MSRCRWIHCNICFHLLDKKDRKFYQLSCRHVLCKQCMGRTNRGTVCPVCQKPLDRFTELTNQMDRADKMFFDPGAIRALQVVSQNVLFQHRQRDHLVQQIIHRREGLPKLREMENQLRQRIVETQRRYEKLRTYRRNLQERLRSMSPRQSSSEGHGAGDRYRVPPYFLSPSAASSSPMALSNRATSTPRVDPGRLTPAAASTSRTVAPSVPGGCYNPYTIAQPQLRAQKPPSVGGFSLIDSADDSGIGSRTPTGSTSFNSRGSAGSSELAQRTTDPVVYGGKSYFKTPTVRQRPMPYGSPAPSTITRDPSPSSQNYQRRKP
ncbi:RING finger protein narya-like [Anopheles cruzii]|uniref:RING finger protein narya-like n=1 Tax=Anopheles cruzii TaxID=68878 RepID=UPI0022EC92E4|nr:RING finger protein narya-like [Anopheles cruzii]